MSSSSARLQGLTESNLQAAGAIMITPDRARPPTQGFVRCRESRDIAVAAAAGETRPAAEHLCAALVALLWRYSQNDTVTVGVFDDVDQSSIPTAAPITFGITSATTADGLLSELRQLSRRESTADLTAEGLAEAVFDRHPLFQVALACLTSAFDDHSASAEVIDDIADSAIRCDLTFVAVRNGDTLTLICDYDADLFEAATVSRLLAQWERLGAAIGDDASRVLATLDMMSPDERDLVMGWSQGPRVERGSHTVHGLLAEQVARSPAAPAVAFADSELNYRELDDIAANFAELLCEYGVGPQAKVVTCLHRSLRVPAVYLGVLKSANAFVPLDPESPVERAEAIFADLGASIMICDSHDDATRFATRSGLNVLILDDVWSDLLTASGAQSLREVRPTDLAYVMYTSGSTGTPKGVMVEHASVCNRLLHNEFELGHDDRVLQKTPLTFDVSLWEIFAPLLHGSQLVMAQPGGHRNPDYLITEMDERSITAVHFVPSMLRQFLKDARPGCCAALRRVTSSGEALALDLIREFRQQFPAVPLYNYYGPTEASIEVTFWRCQDGPTTRTVPIGRPIENVCAYILDELGRPAPIGIEGDLFLGGAALARGYTEPRLDAGRFVLSRWAPSERLYASGDRARWLADGTIEYLGRNDRQVKIRGVRIELGEVEHALLALKDVQNAAVITQHRTSVGEDLIAYVVAVPTAEEVSPAWLRELLRPRLPAYMIPAEFVVVASLPHNSAGKIDYGQLPALKGTEQRSSIAPQHEGGGSLNESAETLRRIWQSVLGRDAVRHDDNFFDLGGNSLLLAEVHRQLDNLFPGRVSRTDLFRLPTIESLSAHLSGSALGSVALNESPPDATMGSGSVAIVGMACQAPGAADIDAFWDLVQSQRRAMRVFSDAELLAADVDNAALSDPDYVRVGAVLDDPALFDADLFGMTPREAQITDPQHRLLLETAHCALEHAGYGSALHRPRCGVFVGGTPSGYFHRYLAHGFHELDPVQHYQIKIGNEIDFLPTLLAYKLDLHGPAMAVQTACSTSLVAVHLAAEALGRNECDIALAGGVTVRVPDRVGYRYQDGMVQSPDGHCRAFDNAAAGTVFGSGVGVVVLKRLEHALGEGDRIYAVIRGSAVNNDGSDKVGYTAPSVRGQAEVIANAHRQAGVTPCQIGYVEAHGTGTALGDPIEIAALAETFGSDAEFGDVCTVGSVKANVGHLDAAAGVVGLIKTALALEHGVRPGQCDVTEPSTRIAWSQTPFRVFTHSTPWPENAPFAGVSAFGIGGTNAHVVLERPPQILPPAPVGPAEQCGMFTISARTSEALGALVDRYINYLGRHPDVNVVDLCRTAASGRSRHRYRLAGAVSTVEELRSMLDGFAQQRPGRAPCIGAAQDVTPRIGVILAGEFNAESLLFVMSNLDDGMIAAAVDRCRTAFGAPTHSSDSEWLAAATPSQRAFTAQFAVITLWMAVGLEPTAVVGLGDGELAAAVWAGAVDLDTAADYVRTHDRLSADRLCIASLGEYCGPELLLGTQGLDDVAIASGLRSHVDVAVLLSGTRSAKASLREQLRREQVRTIDSVDRNYRGTWREFYGCAASLSAAGANVDAWVAGPVSHGRRIALPTYPMQRSRHWIDHAPTTTTMQPASRADLTLPGCEVRLPFSDERRFEMMFHQHAPAYTDHHRLFGTMVIPGASHVAMALAAASHVRPGPLTLTDALFLHPFVLGDNESRRAQLIMRPEQGGGWNARLIAARQLSTNEHDQQWAELFRTSLTFANAAPATILTPQELSEIQHRCPEAMSGDHFYRDVWVPGLDTGNSFHWIDAIWRGKSEALAVTKCPADMQLGGEPIHAGLVEAAFQLLNSCWEYDTASLRQAGEIYVPYSIDRYYFHGQPTGERLWVHAEIAGHGPDDDTFSAGVKMYSPDGQLVIAVEGFTARKISRTRVQDLLTTDRQLPVHTVGWQATLQPTPGDIGDIRAVLIGSTDEELGPLAEKLAARGVDVVAVLARGTEDGPRTDRPTFRSAQEFAAILATVGRDHDRTHVVDLRGLHPPGIAQHPVHSATDISMALLTVVNGIHASSESPDPRLWWVTTAAQAVSPDHADLTDPIASSVWGLACGVRSERPEIRCTTVDLGSESETDFELLATELVSDGDDLRIAYRTQRRYVARIRPVLAKSLPHDTRIRSDRVYLVTGGTSGLGLQMAAWLAACGAQHLILLGRRGISDEVSPEIADIAAGGCAVHVGRVDVSTSEAVQQMRNLMARTGGRPLGGVLHAAGELEDATIARLSRVQIEAVMAAKVAGVHALEELIVRDQYKPDFVVLFSSTAAYLSAAGQANYAAANAYLDAAAHRLRAGGIRCTSIAWGPWAEIGMAARLTESERSHTRGQGIADISTEAGIATMGRLLDAEPANVVAAQVDWLTLRQSVVSLGADPFLDGVAPRLTRPTGEAPLRKQLGGVPSDEREGAIAAMVESIVRQAQGLSEEVLLDRDRGLVEQGFDSLGLVDLRTKLQDGFGVRLPSTFGFDYPTIRLAAAHLANLVGRSKSRTERQPRTPSSARNAELAQPGDSATDSIDEELALLEDMLRTEQRRGSRDSNGF